MEKNIQLKLDVNIKSVDLTIKGEVHPSNKDGIKELSLLGELPHLDKNLGVLLEDEENYNNFYQVIKPFVPQNLNFGIYKLSKENTEDPKLTLFQLSAGYNLFNLKGVFSKELKLFSASINHPISLGQLPLVGEYLKDNNIKKLELVYTPAKEKQPDDEQKKNTIEKELIVLAKEKFIDTQIWKDKDQLALADGFNGGVIFESGDQIYQYRYPYNNTKPDTQKVEESVTTPKKTPNNNNLNQEKSNRKSISSKSKYSPVSISSIKLNYFQDSLYIAIDANFNIGPFGLQLFGLGASISRESQSINKFAIDKVNYHLDGLALSYETSAVKISGAFLREYEDSQNIYNGLLTIKLLKTEVIAVGSYTKIGDISSLFVFGYLGVNIPLHPAINILGLGLGFGLNRKFVMPPISKINSFPIVELINGNPDFEGDKIKSFFQKLNTYITPEDGCYILMGAVKFDSFKLVQTTAIIAVTFGNKLNINLLGISKFEEKGAYNVELAFSVLVDIDNGIFMARGELTNNTYILSPKMKLTGGFSFGMWFKDKLAGDFVMSIGGYHPKFKVPDHYPNDIPRLGLEFSIDEFNFSVKAYFALTPSCIMAGLDAKMAFNFQSTYISADVFMRFVVDMIINFAPFQYNAKATCQIYIDLSIYLGWIPVSYELDLTAKLYIYGPDFGGYGYLNVADYKIPFIFGEQKKIIPFLKEDFIIKYFPVDSTDKILTYNITSGIIKKFKNNENIEQIIVNPIDFELEISSKIPITSINNVEIEKIILNPIDFELEISGKIPITIINNTKIEPNRKIYLACDNNPLLINNLNLELNKDRFIIELIFQSQPKAIWTNSTSSDKLSSQLLEHVCMGIRIKFKQEKSTIIPFTPSLYYTLIKDYVHKKNDFITNHTSKETKKLNKKIMIEFDILTDNEIDYTDLENTNDVYKYKSNSLGSYNIA